jgi:hypothetical protein
MVQTSLIGAAARHWKWLIAEGVLVQLRRVKRLSDQY